LVQVTVWPTCTVSALGRNAKSAIVTAGAAAEVVAVGDGVALAVGVGVAVGATIGVAVAVGITGSAAVVNLTRSRRGEAVAEEVRVARYCR
jgi:hypothetical protein